MKKPRNTKFVHRIDRENLSAVSHKTAMLTLDRDSSPYTRRTPEKSTRLAHSVSSPQLQGVWGTRKSEHEIMVPQGDMSPKLPAGK